MKKGDVIKTGDNIWQVIEYDGEKILKVKVYF